VANVSEKTKRACGWPNRRRARRGLHDPGSDEKGADTVSDIKSRLDLTCIRDETGLVHVVAIYVYQCAQASVVTVA
jgi:hypothetical protein